MALNSGYRTMSLATLEALRTSVLLQIKNIEAVGQDHSLNGRGTKLADFDKLTNTLVDIESAIDWKSTAANNGNNGFASRYSSFGRANCNE